MESTKRALMIISGCISIFLSLVIWVHGVGDEELNKSYGGDAYTGIQNAAAQTSRNVYELACITKLGFGSILFIGGLFIIAFTLPGTPKVETLPRSTGSTAETRERPVGTAATKVCSECGEVLPTHAIACPNCGCPVSK